MSASIFRRESIPRLLLLVLLITLSLYGIFQARNLLLGPIITINTPVEEYVSLETAHLTLSGTTRNISNISLNDSPIFITEEGTFSEELVLPPGYTIMTLSGSDRFGRSVDRRIIIYRTYGT